MKFFKVTLNTVGMDCEKIFFIVPPAEETDESGNPAYDEDFLLTNSEYKSYLKATRAAVVSVAYILYEADDSTKLNYDELLKNEDKFFKLEENDYLIEVKKAKPKSGSKKSSSATLYIVIAIAAVAVVAMLIYGNGLKKSDNESVESITSDVPVDTYSTSSETVSSKTDIETSAEITTASETTTPLTTEITVPITTEELFTLTFDLNGGVGSVKEVEYANGTVVELPFTGTSRIGHTLMGWADAPTEPYTLYDNGISRYIMPSSSATLYAIWTAAEYDVTYNYQIDGNAVTSKVRCKYGELIQLRDISNITSGAGEFVGWGLLPNAEEPVQSMTMPDGGIELYAIYKRTE
ncbi:MAG: InlB B-repeat-containing protein [Eubacterium sp.]|nr:InlB B-repeat-containing protein [Eubacterium sp.]